MNLFKILKNMSPPKIIAMGFLLIIIAGTLLLTLPISSADGKGTAFIDALFVATSATCITGLTPVVTAEHWSLFGKIVIMGLFQIGGLGFMTFVTLTFLVLGKRITLRNRLVIKESYNLSDGVGMAGFMVSMIKFTFIAEAIGALLLSTQFIRIYGFDTGLFYSIFHSISAFCNAGFDLLGESSLVEFSGNYVINITIMLLIITGGIGFPVVLDIYLMLRNRFIKKFSLRICFKNLRLHSKVAISFTLFLIFAGALAFFLGEHNNPQTMGNMTMPHKILACFFQSVTLRTAGYFSIPQEGMKYGSKLVALILMFIGGSPASTAGGAKTVTVAVVLVSVITMLKGEDEVVVFKRNISFRTIRKSLSVIIMMLFLELTAVMLLSAVEGNAHVVYEGIDLFYEVFSAMSTVGVTTGLTPHLSTWGKIIIILCMYIGRIGPITMAMIFTVNGKKREIQYPDGNILVG